MDRWKHARWGGPTLEVLALCAGTRCGRLVDDDSGAPLEGAIALCRRPRPERADRLLSSTGLVLLDGPLLSHLSLLLHEFELPTVALPAHAGESRRDLLRPGSAALLDADAGKLHLLGSDPEARDAAAEWLDALRGLTDGAADEIRWRRASPEVLELSWVAVALYEGLTGEAADRFAEWTRNRLDEELPEVRGSIHERLRLRLLERCRGARRTLRASRELEPLGPLEDRLRRDGERDLDALRRLGAPVADLARAVDDVRRDFDTRREATRAILHTELERALELDDTHARRYYADLVRLAGQARAADVAPARRAPLEARLEALSREEASTEHVRWIVEGSSDDALDRRRVGGKAAGLAQLQGRLPGDCRIPPGFVVPAAAYRAFLNSPPIAGASGEPEAYAERVAETLRRRPLPAPLCDAIERRLAGREDARWAVRSSSTAEDLPRRSLAGQFRSFHGVRGAKDVQRYVREVWTSAWRPQVVRALAWSGRRPERTEMAVLVQEWIDPEVAGVLRTQDPTGQDGRMLVNAAWGMGAGISSGVLPGDLFWLDDRGAVESRVLGVADRSIARGEDPARVLELVLPPELAGKPCLDDVRLARLARLGRRLATSFERPLDLEFGFGQDDVLYVFQARWLS